ncbi:MAG: hypothetical protein Tsb0010_17750 [Parvularculaceae bacterium]
MRAICFIAASQVFLASAAMAGRAQDPAAGSRGEAADELCLEGEIRDWRELETGRLLVERKSGDWRLIEMSEDCNASAAVLVRVIEGLGAQRCLETGSRIDIFGGPERHRCRISGIYKWDMSDPSEPRGGN